MAGTASRGGKKVKQRKQAVSRIAVGMFQMKRFKGGATAVPEEEKTDEEKESDRMLVVANVHLHHALANNSSKLKSKEEHLRNFYDNLARAIITYKVRLVNGNFNTDTIRAVAELRARGFCASMASWFPWHKSGGEFNAQNEKN